MMRIHLWHLASHVVSQKIKPPITKSHQANLQQYITSYVHVLTIVSNMASTIKRKFFRQLMVRRMDGYQSFGW